MASTSPVQAATSDVSCTITANGSPLDSTYQVVSVDVWNGVNKLPKARLVISDGSPADETFPISESSTLIPGATLSIALGYGGTTATVFTGIVYRQGLDVSRSGPSRLIVEATDKAMAMTLCRKNAIFQNSTDSDVCQKLISQAGLTASVTSTSVQHESIVQYYASDWDMLVMRAQCSGMVVTVDNATVTVAPPDTSSSPVLTLQYGDSILDLRTEMDASTQFSASSIQSFAWDPSSQALASSSTAQSSIATPGNLSSDTLAQVFGVSQYLQQTAALLTAAELTQWSSAELVKTQLSKIRGEVRFQGSSLPTPGCTVTLAGLGARFNGAAWVSAVHQHFSNGFWRTTLDLGLSSQWFAAEHDVSAPGASAQVPAAMLQIGVVKQIDQDPDGEYRVLVTLPLLQDPNQNGVWARFGSYYASAGIGSFFYPEINDEVVVGFLSGDPRTPVILGSLYSAKNQAPLQPESQNNTKSIMSRSKLHIDFKEDTNTIAIVTPANQSVQLNDNDGTITLTDKNGNSIKMSSSGIAINSASDINITATGSVTISANSALNASGSASAQFTSSGVVQVKGATVALNP